jgi:MinD superfamily P-loop ATPase
MSDLKRILEVRESLYRKADITINTSNHAVEQSLKMLVRAAQEDQGTFHRNA